jgi:glutamyl-tRNA synthetase
MSKSDPDPAKARLASLANYVADGYVADAVRNYLCLLGWSPKGGKEVMPIDEVVQAFELGQILRHNARFDATKLTWMNGEYIRALPRERFVALARPFLPAAGAAAPELYQRAVLGLVQEKLKLLRELPDKTGYFFGDDYAFDPAAVEKSCRAPGTAARLGQLADRFAAVAGWDAAGLEAALKALAAERGVKTGELIHPCRIATSGQGAGPSLYHLLEVLGRDRVLARLRRGAGRFEA